jgi:alcohol dehydrogenase, propanol-preferring
MRVALPWLGYACGVCRYCNTGRETLCEQQLNTGYGINGSFAEYAVGYARHVVRVPDGVSSADAAPLTCAGVTTYKAVKVSEATSSSLVAVFGAGGLGHLAVQYARITGASVVAVDTNPARLRTALEVGAEHIVNPLEEDPIAAIKRLGGADAAIATAVMPSAFEQAFGSLARGGMLVCVGLPAENHLKIPHFETVLAWCDELRTLGVRANADTPKDARRAREFGAEGVGLCRTEHMFMAADRQPKMLADDEAGRRAALDELLPMQQAD